MSIKLMKAIWGVKRGFITSTEKFVLLRLADFEQENYSSIYPSLEMVSRETDLSVRTVQRAIKSLVNKNLLELIKPFTPRTPNVYRVNVEAFLALQKGGSYEL